MALNVNIFFCYLIGSCYDGLTGEGYTGTLSTTKSGKTCQRWDGTSPHWHNQNPDNFPEKSLTAAENYCRNPDGEPAPWCYTTDPEERWDFCDVPACKGTEIIPTIILFLMLRFFEFGYILSIQFVTVEKFAKVRKCVFLKAIC